MHSIGASLLLIETHAVERRQAKGADFEVPHFLAKWLENRRVRNRRYRYLFFKDFFVPADTT